MFSIFNKQKRGTEVVIKISGMHCTSCALNIDGELEDLAGVYSSETSYAKSQVKVEYDPSVVTLTEVIGVITAQGYQVVSE